MDGPDGPPTEQPPWQKTILEVASFPFYFPTSAMFKTCSQGSEVGGCQLVWFPNLKYVSWGNRLGVTIKSHSDMFVWFSANNDYYPANRIVPQRLFDSDNGKVGGSHPIWPPRGSPQYLRSASLGSSLGGTGRWWDCAAIAMPQQSNNTNCIFNMDVSTAWTVHHIHQHHEDKKAQHTNGNNAYSTICLT